MSAAAIGAVAGAAALALPAAETAPATWRPITHGLTASPDRLLPTVVSAAHPVRVVSTTLDPAGRPVVTVHTATDRGSALALVTEAQQADHAVGVELDVPMSATESDPLRALEPNAGKPLPAAEPNVSDPLPTTEPNAGKPLHAAEVDVPMSIAGGDPFRAAQWDFAGIRVAEAWPRSTGAGVTVAVVDSGVDASHPDLAGQVLPGVDFITGTEGTAVDPNGHGTHVAGTIAALAGNDVGISGVAPDAKILPVRVLAANGSGYMSDAANGIVYATERGADVINLSLGATTQVGAVTNAIAYARSKGVVVVAAAGNTRAAGSPASYPAADPGVIAVAATDSADNVAHYSNRGGYVDVAAPGSDILSTYPAATGSEYRRLHGTSMAAPHVAAVAALLKAGDRGLTPEQVEQALTSSAADLGAPGRDDDYGSGRIDAAAAVATLSPPPAAPAPEPATTTPEPPTSDPAAPAPAEPDPGSPSPGDPAPADPTPGAPTPGDPTPGDPTPGNPTPGDPAPGTPAPNRPEPSPPAPEAPAPNHPSPAAPIRPVVTVAGTEHQVAYGRTTTTTFTVTAAGDPYAHRPAEVCVSIAGDPPTCTPTTTGDAGTVTWTRRATAPYQVRLTVPGAADTTVSYLVRAVATISRPGPGSLTLTLGGVDGQTIHLQRLDGRAWVTDRTFPAAARTRIGGLTAGRHYRVVVPDTARFAGTTSAASPA